MKFEKDFSKLIKIPDLRIDIEKCFEESCAKACIHGTIHRAKDDKLINKSEADFLLTLLALSGFEDDFDKRYKEVSPPGTPALLPGECTLEPELCSPACFGGDIVRQKEALKQSTECTQLYKELEAAAEIKVQKAIERNEGVWETYKKEGMNGLVLGELASKLGPSGLAELHMAVEDTMKKVIETLGDSPELRKAQEATRNLIEEVLKQEEE